jgi:hypothetical protein
MNRTAELSVQDVGRKKHNLGFRPTMIFLLLPAALITLYTRAALHYAYSSGERAGYIQKISRKGQDVGGRTSNDAELEPMKATRNFAPNCVVRDQVPNRADRAWHVPEVLHRVISYTKTIRCC